MNKSAIDFNIRLNVDKKSKKSTFSNLLFTSKDSSNPKGNPKNELTAKKEYNREKNYLILFGKPKCTNEGLNLIQSSMRIKNQKSKLLNYSTENYNCPSLTRDKLSISSVHETKKVYNCNIRLKNIKMRKESSKSLHILMEANDKMRKNSNKKFTKDKDYHNISNNKYESQLQSSFPKVSNHLHHPKSKLSNYFQLYHLSELKDNNKSGAKSRKISQCFSSSIDFNEDDYDIVYNDEKENIILNEKPNLVKTSLIKLFKRRLNDNNRIYIQEKEKNNNNQNNDTSYFTELLKQEKENANKHYLKKKQLMLNSYQKKNNRNFVKKQAINLNFLSLTQIKIKNNNYIKFLRNEMQKKLNQRVDKSNNEKKKYEQSFRYILDENLIDVKSELNQYLA